MSDVPRETSLLIAHYADVPGLAQYAAILATDGLARGLLGPREVPRLWPRHLANCAVVAEGPLIVPGARVADIGSGAGLPGIVWALVRPDLRMTLIEPLLRRATFLGEVVAALGLEARVTVVRTRAEDLADSHFDVVTARAVAPLERLVSWCMPLVVPGGLLVALKGSSAGDEVDSIQDLLRTLRVGPARIETFGSGLLAEPTRVVVVPRPLG